MFKYLNFALLMMVLGICTLNPAWGNSKSIFMGSTPTVFDFCAEAMRGRLNFSLLDGRPYSSAERDAVNELLKKIPAQDIHNFPVKNFETFFLGIRQVNLNNSDPRVMTLIPYAGLPFHYREPIRYELDPILVQGWKQLGMVGENGIFGDGFDLDQVAENFTRLTGMKSVVSDVQHQSQFLSHSPFEFSLKIAVLNEFPLDDLHSIVFHLPYLVNPELRRLMKLSANFLILESFISKVSGSFEDPVKGVAFQIMNELFEGAAPSGKNNGITILYANMAIDRQTNWPLFKEPRFLWTDHWTKTWAEPLRLMKDQLQVWESSLPQETTWTYENQVQTRDQLMDRIKKQLIEIESINALKN
jgi:hypothetical protein